MQYSLDLNRDLGAISFFNVQWNISDYDNVSKNIYLKLCAKNLKILFIEEWEERSRPLPSPDATSSPQDANRRHKKSAKKTFGHSLQILPKKHYSAIVWTFWRLVARIKAAERSDRVV